MKEAKIILSLCWLIAFESYLTFILKFYFNLVPDIIIYLIILINMLCLIYFVQKAVVRTHKKKKFKVVRKKK